MCKIGCSSQIMNNDHGIIIKEKKIPTACTDLLTEWIQAVGYYRYRSVINKLWQLYYKVVLLNAPIVFSAHRYKPYKLHTSEA